MHSVCFKLFHTKEEAYMDWRSKFTILLYSNQGCNNKLQCWEYPGSKFVEGEGSWYWIGNIT